MRNHDSIKSFAFHCNFIFPLIVFVSSLILVWLICLLISAAPASIAKHPMVDVWLRLFLFIFILLVALVYFLRIDESLKCDIVVGLLGVWLAAVVILTLKNSPYTLNGISGDKILHTSYVTKFAHYKGYVDFAYKGLGSYYPPLYFYVLGRVSSVFGIPSYFMLKYGLLSVVFLLPFITQQLWQLIVDKKTAAALTFIILAVHIWYKPAEWISLAMFVPWWICFADQVTRADSTAKKIWRLLAGSVLGSIIFQTYYYWFFVGGVSLILSVVLGRFTLGDNWADICKSLRYKILLLAGTAILSSVYWFPYLYSMYKTGGWQPMQNRWLKPEWIVFELPFMTVSVGGLLAFLGLIYLLLICKRDKLSLALLNLLASSYLWFVLGYVGIVTNHPFLASKAMYLVNQVLFSAAIIALIRLWQKGNTRLWFYIRPRNLAAVLIILLLIFFGQNFVQDFANEPKLKNTFSAKYPDKFLSAFKAMTKQDYAGKVVLTAFVELPIYLPVYTFISSNAHYSHPAGLFDRRIEFLEKLSKIDDPELFAAALMNNKYSHIDYLVLAGDGTELYLTYLDDNFPRGIKGKKIVFDKKIFDRRYFSAIRAKKCVFMDVLHESNPVDLSRIDLSKQETYNQDKPRIIYQLYDKFGDHVGCKEVLNGF